MQVSKNTINIGGKIYDAESGKLLKVMKPQLDIIPSKTNRISQARTKKSTTLNRDFVKNPQITAKPRPQVIGKRVVRHPAPKTQPELRKNTFKSRQIKHFMTLEEAKALNSKKPVVLSVTELPQKTVSHEANLQFKQIIADARKTAFFTRHRISQITAERQKKELQALRQAERAFSGQKNQLPSRTKAEQQAINTQIKRQTLAQAIANDSPERPAYRPRQSFLKRHASLIAGTLSVIILGAYLTYLNAPNISIRIAANQAGISATYPEYRPLGYSLKGLAHYDSGKVTIEYQNQDKTMTLTQQASQWDSKTALENIVKKQAGETYSTDQTKGLTIYTYNNQATWVNGGVLYNLSFNDDVSLDQIHRIATSL